MYRVFLSLVVFSGLSGISASDEGQVDIETQPTAIPDGGQADAKTQPAAVPKPQPDLRGTPPIINPLDGIDITSMKLVDGAYRSVLKDGRRVTFTVDPALQQYSDNLFAKYQVPAGAAVMINSRTGRVLALSQHRTNPKFGPTEAVALDPSPPAASLFKVITAAALLEKGDASISTSTCYNGGARKLLLSHLEEPPTDNRSCASLATALGMSINAIFARLSDRRLKRHVLLEYAERFGFNRELPFDVSIPPSTADIPTDRLERARTAAGFWHVHISPMHAALIAQSLAQKGAMLRPYIVDKVEGPDRAVLHEAHTAYLSHTVSQASAESLLKAMTHTVRRGTARKAFRDQRGSTYLPGIEVAGKTGTLNGKHPFRTFSWFMGAAPVDRPEVAIAVLVVNEPKWRIRSATAAALLLKKYFEITRKSG
ncbi:MAG: penicillin-binding transpeptidase domain-containing protein [Myxococcota bacterium]|nr:penicillin-binding transpeptidase domain-containing protein [Myxococcota bacterium]